MKKQTIQLILEKYQNTKLYECSNPVLLSGYRSFAASNLKYRATSNIMLVINARAYYIRTKSIMATAIAKAIKHPELIINNHKTEA